MINKMILTGLREDT